MNNKTFSNFLSINKKFNLEQEEKIRLKKERAEIAKIIFVYENGNLTPIYIEGQG